MATQITAAPNTSDAACRICELVAAGVIGPVREVHVWSDRPWWPQGMLRRRSPTRCPQRWIGKPGSDPHRSVPM